MYTKMNQQSRKQGPIPYGCAINITNRHLHSAEDSSSSLSGVSGLANESNLCCG